MHPLLPQRQVVGLEPGQIVAGGTQVNKLTLSPTDLAFLLGCRGRGPGSQRHLQTGGPCGVPCQVHEPWWSVLREGPSRGLPGTSTKLHVGRTELGEGGRARRGLQENTTVFLALQQYKKKKTPGGSRGTGS